MPKKKIDYDKWSKEELVREIRRIKDKKYGLVWHRDIPEEKIDVFIDPDARTPSEMFPNEVLGKPFPILKEVKTKAISSDKSHPVNLLIEGDNYHSLAVLNFTHQGAIDLIYIDPPYNTGSQDFIYNDKFQSGYVEKDDPFKHSKWLAFMEKRLKLAKKLLKDEGVILISIDDNEFAQLKLLCDEIFGERNFVGNLVWYKKRKGSYLSKELVHVTEYIFAYKNTSKPITFYGGRPSEAESQPLVKRTNARKELKFPPNFVKTKLADGQCKKGVYGTGSSSVILLQDTRVKSGVFIDRFNLEGPFTWSQKMLDEQISLGASIIINTKNFQPRVFRKYNESHSKGLQTFIDGRELSATTDDAYENLKDIFGIDRPFDYSKPYQLIKFLVNTVTSQNKNAIVLDFMAGSGTTGQAVMELNKEDGGNRQFILCTNNENQICTKVCYPRIKRIMKGYKNTRKENKGGLGGNLKYYRCDFVEAEPTDRNKRKLVNESTEMLCIKENTFELVQDKSDFKVFRNSKKYLGIIFYEDAIEKYKKEIIKIDGHFNTYVFSLGDDSHEMKFANVKRK